MAVQYEHARPGYQFIPTTKGTKVGRIANKYKDTYHSPQYKVCVPKRWITEKWVIEVKEGT